MSIKKNVMVAAAAICLLTPSPTVSAQAITDTMNPKVQAPKAVDIDLNASNFPDSNFRSQLVSYDIDGNGKLSAAEVANITSLSLTNVLDITGVKLLTSLSDLTVAASPINKIDVRGMTSLTNINYYGNPNLKTLDLRDCPNLVYANHSVNNETVLISAGMTKYVACSAIPEHTGHIIIDLRGIATINPDGSKSIDLKTVISPTLIAVFEEHSQPGYDPATNILTIPKEDNSSDYTAGIDGNNADTSWTFYTDYDHPTVVGGDITAKYVDEAGNEISADVVKSGNVGDSYTTDQKSINGYTFKEVQGNVSGTFTDQAQTVTYVYTKNPVKAGNVTAKYVDEAGNEISADVVKSGNVGDAYTTDKKTISGYTFKEVQGNSVGNFTDKAQIVTYVYSKEQLVPVKPSQQTPSTIDNHPIKPNDKQVQKSIQPTKTALPKTAKNQKNSSLMMTSLILAGATLIVVAIKKRLRN
jgi:uncharacterized surface anchored protein